MMATLEAMDLRTPRQRMWDAIRANANDFTLEMVRAAAGMKLDAARDYLRGLERAGFCEKSYEVPFSTADALIAPVQMQATYHYMLIKDVGNSAPRVNRTGKLVVDGSTKNEAMWRALRIGMPVVTPRSLAAFASAGDVTVSEETANTYLKLLYRAGYLALVEEHKCGVRQAKYRLLPSHNTGPKPPQIQRTRRVFDPNIGAIIYQECPDDENERDGLEVNHVSTK